MPKYVMNLSDGALSEFSLASEIIAVILTLVLVISFIIICCKEYESVKTEREQERVFKEQLLLHFENIDHNLCQLCRNLDEDIVFD